MLHAFISFLWWRVVWDEPVSLADLSSMIYLLRRVSSNRKVSAHSVGFCFINCRNSIFDVTPSGYVHRVLVSAREFLRSFRGDEVIEATMFLLVLSVYVSYVRMW